MDFIRHSNATLMLACGVPAKVASERLGHNAVSITLDLYSHVLDSMQKDAADIINLEIFAQKALEEVSPIPMG